MSSPEKYPELRDIRKGFKVRQSAGRQYGYSHDSLEASKVRVGRNMFERNDAKEAQQWKTINERPRSIVSRRRLRRHHRIDATSHECEIFGPLYCSRCVRRAQQRKFEDQVLSVFPVVNLRASLVHEQTDAANERAPAQVRVTSQQTGARTSFPKPERSILMRGRRKREERGTRLEYSDATHPSNCQLHRRVMNKSRRQYILQNGDVINNFVTYPADSERLRHREHSDIGVKKAYFQL